MENLDCCLCVYCQEHNDSEPLVCPATNSTHKDKLAGYRSVVRNINELKSLGENVPFDINDDIDEEQSAELLYEKKAKWHKTCRNNYSSKTCQRIKKRK